MDRIRIFIYGSAVVLCSWLTASYTYQPNAPRETHANTTEESATPAANTQLEPGEETGQEPLDAMATLEKH